MIAKTDNPSEVGVHVFERAKLGTAPFRCVGFDEKVYQACPGAPIQPGSSCDYCGQGIRYVYLIKGRTGEFKVGSDCVDRTGDAGLIKSYKNHPSVRAASRAKAREKDRRVVAEWEAITRDGKNRQVLTAHQVDRWGKGVKESWLPFAEHAWRMCGASGRARYLRAAKKIIAEGAR